MDFMVDPAALEDLEHNLKVDERVLRYVLQKKDPLPRLPTTYKVSKLARALRERQLLPVGCSFEANALQTPPYVAASLRSPWCACRVMADVDVYVHALVEQVICESR